MQGHDFDNTYNYKISITLLYLIQYTLKCCKMFIEMIHFKLIFKFT